MGGSTMRGHGFILGAALAVCIVGLPAAHAKPDGEPVKALDPLVFYIAHGDDSACGEGCGEWIAADGAFDQGSAARFRRFLGKLGGRKLPIFFNSPGGIVGEAIAIGRAMHQAGMTAGVALTVPEECRRLTRRRCTELKRAPAAVASELYTADAHCNSACVYALIGAPVRQVPPGARLGIHSDKLVRIYSDGRMVAPDRAQLSPRERAKVDEDHRKLKSYVVEMGMSADLLDAASRVSHKSVHTLTRDELARYGIDAREFQETRWLANDPQWQSPSVVKFVTERKGDAAKEYRTSFLRLACLGNGKLRLDYVRGLASFEAGIATTVTVGAGERKLTLTPRGTVDAESISDVQSQAAPAEFFEEAAHEPSIQLIESSTAPGGEERSRIVSLSTAGLAHALAVMRPQCGPDT